jgi:hypothetical protein
MKPKACNICFAYITSFRLSVVCSMFWFGPFNGFEHYDYVCEISPKNSMFFI